MSVDVQALPFDQYQRYRLVSDLVDEVRKPGETFHLLDVGGRTALLRSFLPRDRVTLVDLEASGERPLVLGDGSRLPFRDQSFDAALAFDTLEHVPPARRAAFVAECARVSRRWVVIAGPYQAPEVEESERLLQRFLVDKLGVEHRYLEEHRHNGLPSREATEKGLKQAGFEVTSLGHGNLERWLALMCLSMYLDYEPRLRPLAARVFRFYNQNLYASDHARPVYRHAVVGAARGTTLPRGDRGLEPPVAPAGVLARFREVVDEIVCFDRARDDWRAERERLSETIATLETDLAGHKVSLSEVRAASVEQADVIRTLETDLAGHRESLGTALDDLERERTEGARVRRALETDLDAHREVVTTLERDLDAHRDLVRGIETQLEEHRALGTALRNEIDQQRSVLTALEADLAGHVASLAESERIRAEQESSIADLLQEREGLRAHLVALESSLADERLVRAERERDLRELRATVVTLSADLAEHRRTLASREREFQAERGRYEAHVAEHLEVERVLNRDLDGHRALAADLRSELEVARRAHEAIAHELNQARQDVAGKAAEIARAAEALRAQDALVGALRAELKNRWRTLRRALGPKRPTPGE